MMTATTRDPLDAAADVVLAAIRKRADLFDASHRLPRGTTYRLISCGRGLTDFDLEVLAYVLNDLNECYEAARASVT